MWYLLMAEVKIGRMVMGSYQTNCYFLYRGDRKDVIVIDPGDQGSEIYNNMRKHGFVVRAILLTHGHFDHIWGLDELRNIVNAAAESDGEPTVKVYACESERELLKNVRMNVSELTGRPCSTYADVYLNDGEELVLAGITLRVIATPGHTVGGCCYYVEEASILVAGDTLFEESVGRSDFPTGDSATLIKSIRERLFVLPDDTRVYPGHGGSTTIGHEKRYNPFCALAD